MMIVDETSEPTVWQIGNSLALADWKQSDSLVKLVNSNSIVAMKCTYLYM
jgi:hypothetical protein